MFFKSENPSNKTFKTNIKSTSTSETVYNPNTKYARNYKIVMLGDSGAGKTSLMNRFVDKSLNISSSRTFGLDFLMRDIVINKENVRLTIWDTAGTERFKSLSNMQIRGAHAYILCVDITNPNSFNELHIWLDKIKNSSTEQVPIFLVGTKNDLDYTVHPDIMKGFAELKNLSGCFQTSAVTGEGVDEVFFELAETIYDSNKAETKASIKLDDANKEDTQDSSCCGGPSK
jgi:small GTP-binding protein